MSKFVFEVEVVFVQPMENALALENLRTNTLQNFAVLLPKDSFTDASATSWMASVLLDGNSVDEIYRDGVGRVLSKAIQIGLPCSPVVRLEIIQLDHCASGA